MIATPKFFCHGHEFDDLDGVVASIKRRAERDYLKDAGLQSGDRTISVLAAHTGKGPNFVVEVDRDLVVTYVRRPEKNGLIEYFPVTEARRVYRTTIKSWQPTEPGKLKEDAWEFRTLRAARNCLGKTNTRVLETKITDWFGETVERWQASEADWKAAGFAYRYP